MKTRIFLSVVMLCALALSAPAQSAFRDFANAVDATIDAARENREQNAAAADIRAIFDKAKRAKTNGGVDFCGFYVGMEKTDATALVGYYGLGYDDSSFDGDPLVHSIHFSLAGVRKMMKGGNSFEELCQGVANRVGDLKYVNDFLEGEKWEYKTIDGIVVKIRDNKTVGSMNLVNAFIMEDTTGNIKARSERAQKERVLALQQTAEQEFNNSSVSVQERPVMEIPLADNVSMRFRQLPNGLWFGETEVTQEQWESLMGNNPSYLRWPTRPVDSVSWKMCQQFIKRFNEQIGKEHEDIVFRLPNPDEWRYACKAGSAGKFCLAANGKEVTTETLGLMAWIKDNSDDQTHPVGKKMPNAWGLYDMLGNVQEWGPRDETKNDEQFHLYGGRYSLPAIWEHGVSFFETDSAHDSSDEFGSQTTGFRLCAVSREEESRKENELAELKKEKDATAIAKLIADMVAIPGRNYSIGKYEITQAQWSAVMGNNPAERKGDDFPVENITWKECLQFMMKLNERPEVKAAGLRFLLPTAEEWWHACHAGSSEMMGNISCYLEDGTLITEKTLDRIGWLLEKGSYVGHDSPRTIGGHLIASKTHPVGKKVPNAFGLYDMFGNVQEMVDTECGALNNRASDHAKKQGKDHHHLCCGGSWKLMPPAPIFWGEDGISSTNRFNDVGFRLLAEKVVDSLKQLPKDFPTRKMGLSKETLTELDEKPRLINFSTLATVANVGIEKYARWFYIDPRNDPEKAQWAMFFLMNTLRTIELLNNLDHPLHIQLLFAGNKMEIDVNTEEEAYAAMISFIESLPDSPDTNKLRKMVKDETTFEKP